MARFFYSIAFILTMPLVLLNLYLKSKDIPAYRKRWREHFGIFIAPNIQRSIWVHAVSVGESLAAIPIIKRLKKRYPDIPIIVTTTTPTGAERIYAMLGESVLHIYSPYDFPWVVRRFVMRVKPILTVIMETELWPNLIHYCRRKKIPVVVVNARLSSRSANNYSRLPIPTKQLLLDPITHLACQSESDAKRFVRLGAEQSKVSVTGSVKFDLQLPSDLKRESDGIFAAWKEGAFVITAGSTHAGEDEILLKALRELYDLGIDAKLIIVPRHPERFDSVAELVEQRGFKLTKRSEKQPIPNESEVFLCDSMGEMMLCYHAADVAFVGGSFIERGGHNPLEPAALAKPVITGKHIFNFSDVFKNMFDAGAAEVVAESQLVEVLERLIKNPKLCKEMGTAGIGVVESNRGAISRTLKILYRYLDNDKKG